MKTIAQKNWHCKNKNTTHCTCWDATPKKANFVKGCWGINLGDRHIVHNRILTKCWCSHEMEDGFSRNRESRMAIIEHHTLACCRPHFSTQVCLPRFAEFAFSTLCLIARNHMVTHLHLCHSWSNTLHYSATIKTHKLPLSFNLRSGIHVKLWQKQIFRTCL